MDPHSSGRVLDRIVGWAAANDSIRAAILEGSRANPNAVPDGHSDYDLAIIVADTRLFIDDDWEKWYGDPVIHWGERQLDGTIERLMRLVVYADGIRID